MNYPGNPSLSADAQQRILGTFDQTLDLAEQGSRQEALLGCDFVLRMDPQFEPARRLLDRLKVGTGAVQVADLKEGAEESPLGDDFLDSLNFEELPSLDDELPGFAGNGDGSGGGNLRVQLQELLDARRFQDLLTVAQQQSAAVAADPELQRIAGIAQERLEAEPYILKFLSKARQAAQAGQGDEVTRMLERARSLDASHPGIAEIERMSAASAPPPAPAASAPPSPVTELPAALRPTATPPIDLFSGGGGGDSESERRIDQLLAEGQSAFDSGDPQAAIDAWSRIFLIDIDHQEAARRIDLARKLKAENERQVEEIFHDGLNRLEAGDLAAARQAFEQVLALQPSYLAAREYVQQIDAGEVPVLAPRSASREMPVAAPMAAAPLGSEPLALPDFPEGAGELKEEILVPPEPGEMPAHGERRQRQEPRRTADRKGLASKRFLVIGGGVLAVVLLAAGFLYLRWDSLFPNLPNDRPVAAPGPAAPRAAANPIQRAMALHNQGKTQNATTLLQRLPPTDPHYAEAQKLLAQWATEPAPAVGTEGAPGAAPATPAVALAPDVAARRQQLLDAAHQEAARGDYLGASNHFEQAAALAKLEPPEAAQQADLQKKLQPLAEQIKLFKQHDWEYIVPTLWRLREGNPDDRAINRLLIDSYYNLGVRDLQRADPLHAASQFTEALKLDPGDAVLRRHYLFAQTYQERPQDLLFRIYVKYLPYR